MPKFSPGDPVWVREDGSGNYLSPGEYPAIVICRSNRLSSKGYPLYQIDLPSIKLPAWAAAAHTPENMMRPRRDDYQQQEKLGSMDEVFTPKFDERSLELACEAMKEAKEDAMARGRMKAARFALMYGADPGTIRRMLKRAP